MSEKSDTITQFEFSGGRVCLDFINTLSDRWRVQPVEVLHTYADLLAWARLAQILDEKQSAQLERGAEQQPELAARGLVEIKQARNVLFQMMSKIAGGKPGNAWEIGQFNQLFTASMTHLSLMPSGPGFAWHWSEQGNSYHLPLWPIIRDAAELLTSPDLRFVRMCASDDCDWLFLDTSKNHSRRWCDMNTCGNRAKARRYYGRQKQASEA
ncbi:MAG TPA: ABATE domain-containing protein [Ktedonobacteraceae bacterium]